MLEFLRIHNLALIEDLEVEFSQGMNVLTGETGAGKSFILKALEFLTGEKLATDLVRSGCDKASVEGLFWMKDEELILRRELIAETGRSRFYVNGRLSSQDIIKEMRSALIIHTSQHGQQKLMQTAFQGKILDDFMDRPDLITKKEALAGEFNKIQNEQQELLKKIANLEEKRDVLEYQLIEINKVCPLPGEEEDLEKQRITARSQANIAESVTSALTQLQGGNETQGVYDTLASFEKSLLHIAKYREDLADLTDAMPEVLAILHDAEKRLKKAAKESQEDIDIEHVESRLYMLAQLKRKLKRPLSAILSLQEEVSANLEFLDSCELEQKRLAIDEEEVCNKLALTLQELNEKRRAAADAFSLLLEKELATLGFSEHVKVIFSFTPVPLHPTRVDCVELKAKLLWQPNPGQPAQPLDKIASGGELSRFLLAVVTLMSKKADETPTLIFDEVDAGVGGFTLNKVAERLSELASTRQMLLITHWPQLAQKGQRHFVVEKKVIDSQTYTLCRQLSKEEIPKELDRMAGLEANV